MTAAAATAAADHGDGRCHPSPSSAALRENYSNESADMRTLDTIGISARGHRTVSGRPAVLDQGTVDELLSAEEFPAEFDESVDNSTLYAEYRRLAAEQAALRRLASLVARGVEPSKVFEAVTDEMRRCVQVTRAGLLRYESNGEVTIVGAAYHSDAPAKWPVGTRYPIGRDTLAAVVRRTGRAARLDTYDNVAGALAARMRKVGVRAAVACRGNQPPT